MPLVMEEPIITVPSMDALEVKREVETLSERLGKTQDYL
jgi:hypothetical protein